MLQFSVGTISQYFNGTGAIEVSVNSPVCSICGCKHQIQDCNLVRITSYVKDKKIPPKYVLTLPSCVRIEVLADGIQRRVVANITISRGTLFGPFEGRLVDVHTNDPPSFIIKRFIQNEVFVLDNSLPEECNWMVCVSAAENLEEQNLICFEDVGGIFYAAVRDILPNDELKVWYSPNYARKLGLDVLKSEVESKSTTEIDINSLICTQQNIEVRESWTCKFCNHVETKVVTFAQHLFKHYHLELRKICEICQMSFSTTTRLKTHQKIVHGQDCISADVKSKLPNKMFETDSFSGPLLADMFPDSLDNISGNLNQFGSSLISLSNSMLLDNADYENLLLETDTNNMSTFNFIDLDQDSSLPSTMSKSNADAKQYTCDICQRKFAHVKLLLLHLKWHTGEYVCTTCLKVFARKESYDHHFCRINPNSMIECNVCGKQCYQKKYLARHMLSHQDLRHRCVECGKGFVSLKALQQHNCIRSVDETVRQANIKKRTCEQCNKTFSRPSQKRRHMELHKKKDFLICDVCGTVLKTPNSYYLHMRSHQEKQLECKFCNKMFARNDVLRNHLETHAENAVQCPKCTTVLKNNHVLQMHMQSKHGNYNRVKCKKCSAAYKRHVELRMHEIQCHGRPPISRPVSRSASICTLCNKSLKSRSSLLRHLQQVHPAQNCAPINTSLEGLYDEPVILSIPDLEQASQDIVLDKKAYILEDGTIIQPKDEENSVILYKLGNIT